MAAVYDEDFVAWDDDAEDDSTGRHLGSEAWSVEGDVAEYDMVASVVISDLAVINVDDLSDYAVFVAVGY